MNHCQMRPKISTDLEKFLIFQSQLSKKDEMPKGRWLLFVDQTNYTDDFFSDVNIPFDSEFLVVHKGDSRDFIYTEVYRISPFLHLRTHRFTSLSYLLHGFVRRRPDLQGLVLRSAIMKSVSGGQTLGVSSRRLLVFVTPCSVVVEYQRSRGHLHPEDGGSWDLCNVGTLPQHYTTSQKTEDLYKIHFSRESLKIRGKNVRNDNENAVKIL
jgi:hypothetical protein